MSIRTVPLAALMIVGLAASAAAQMMGPGMPMPGQIAVQQQRPQEPPCYREFAPLKAEAEKRGLAVKNATERKDKAPREEVCTLLKRYSEAEGADRQVHQGQRVRLRHPARGGHVDAAKSRPYPEDRSRRVLRGAAALRSRRARA